MWLVTSCMGIMTPGFLIQTEYLTSWHLFLILRDLHCPYTWLIRLLMISCFVSFAHSNLSSISMHMFLLNVPTSWDVFVISLFPVPRAIVVSTRNLLHLFLSVDIALQYVNLSVSLSSNSAKSDYSELFNTHDERLTRSAMADNTQFPHPNRTTTLRKLRTGANQTNRAKKCFASCCAQLWLSCVTNTWKFQLLENQHPAISAVLISISSVTPLVIAFVIHLKGPR